MLRYGILSSTARCRETVETVETVAEMYAEFANRYHVSGMTIASNLPLISRSQAILTVPTVLESPPTVFNVIGTWSSFTMSIAPAFCTYFKAIRLDPHSVSSMNRIDPRCAVSCPSLFGCASWPMRHRHCRPRHRHRAR
eukprot:2519592-Pyramimonas_sp.AAC.1